jgi:anti-anti-sigma regulatory factor
MAAPARLDVHHLPELEAWIGTHGTGRFRQLELDCSAVEFIDVTAVETILSAERDPARTLRIARPSTAMRITFELLGYSLVANAVAA